MGYLVLFPPEAIALQEELQYHPTLVQKLLDAGPLEQDFPSKLATIATYCDVLVDGDYSINDIVKLCDVLVRKLQRKRVIVLLQ